MEEYNGKPRRRYSLSGRRTTRNHNVLENSTDNVNDSTSRSVVEDSVKIKNENLNSIGQSGNSDVDIQIDVHVDTTAIAFALLTSLLATKQMSSEEFEEAVKRLESLTGKRSPVAFEEKNDVSNVKYFNRNMRRYE
ncbi:hypothetical protein D1B31_19840 [Neobacillus notoginsengisoli]|uniref:Uncharacterized protein n=1 Tax=Neobacillus notoginsengisoli TaxID=1578198 RepID=A0A417YL92_9BACI|nr:hypothetical protein [Neobacillus notoginsengisoli]RHW34154.1 hypothetical protein D1B31_19840 [Neobacillus notoginsengisoli]